MRVVLLIQLPDAIEKILRHLHLWEDEPPHNRAPPVERVVVTCDSFINIIPVRLERGIKAVFLDQEMVYSDGIRG